MSSSQGFIFICSLLLYLCSLSSPFSTTPKTIPAKADNASGLVTDPTSTHPFKVPSRLSGDWFTAKQSLRNPKCCVVAVPGLEHHLSTIQEFFCGDDAPTDLDLRMRVRCRNKDIEEVAVAYKDCAKIYNSVMEPSSSVKDAINFDWDENHNLSRESKSNQNNISTNHPCILALEELARGVASLADGPLDGKCTDVHMRVVCASNYQAIDPMFHTDKCPLRGYVTLTGLGTQYMNETCLPWEYAALRTLGANGL